MLCKFFQYNIFFVCWPCFLLFIFSAPSLGISIRGDQWGVTGSAGPLHHRPHHDHHLLGASQWVQNSCCLNKWWPSFIASVLVRVRCGRINDLDKYMQIVMDFPLWLQTFGQSISVSEHISYVGHDAMMYGILINVLYNFNHCLNGVWLIGIK